MKTLQIFEYNSEVGATSDVENGTFLNDPDGPNQLGVVVSVEDAVISPAALAIMKNNCAYDGGSFAAVMLTEANDNQKSSIGIMGYGKHKLTNEQGLVVYSRDCRPPVLDEIEVSDDIEVPQEFKDYIDTLYPQPTAENPVINTKLYKPKYETTSAVQITKENICKIKDFLSALDDVDSVEVVGDEIKIETPDLTMYGKAGDYIAEFPGDKYYLYSEANFNSAYGLST